MPLHGFRSAPLLGFIWDPIVATGGTTSTYTVNGVIYKVHKFTTVGTSTFTVTNTGSTGEIEYVVIGGGGGSGGIGDDVQIGGGGGAGGYRSNVKGENTGGGLEAESRMFISPGSYSVVVGGGGGEGSGGSRSAGGTGGTSSFNGIVANGGGGGGGSGSAGQPGASGGGGNVGNANGGASIAGQGFHGGVAGAYGLSSEGDVQGGTGAGGGGGSAGSGYPGVSPGEETKAACNVATTENISLSPAPSTIDGVSLTNGMRVLVKDQNNAVQNGIYSYSSTTGNLTRATDMDGLSFPSQVSSESDPGIYTTVTSGTVNGGTSWSTVSTRTRPTLNVDEIRWETPGRVPPRGGDGGLGTLTKIFNGTSTRYAGGGGAGSGSGSLTSPAGVGSGGGGNGKQSGIGKGSAGSANTGGGAGGSAYYSTTGGTVGGQAGGSGVVAIRYVLGYE